MYVSYLQNFIIVQEFKMKDKYTLHFMTKM